MKKINLFIYFFYLISLILLLNCNTLEGHRGISRNIAESKEREVFVTTYSMPTNPYRVNDSLTLYIKNAWLEKRWHYTKKQGESKSDSGYRLIIESDSLSLKNYFQTWTIGIDYMRYFEINPNQNILHIEFDSLPSNREVFQVQKGSNLKKEGNKIIIGTLVLINNNSM